MNTRTGQVSTCACSLEALKQGKAACTNRPTASLRSHTLHVALKDFYRISNNQVPFAPPPSRPAVSRDAQDALSVLDVPRFVGPSVAAFYDQQPRAFLSLTSSFMLLLLFDSGTSSASEDQRLSPESFSAHVLPLQVDVSNPQN